MWPKLLMLSLLVALALLVGCASRDAGVVAAATPSVTDGVTVESSGLPVGNRKTEDGRYICPVKGIPIRDMSRSETVVYQGILFYFDCVGSRAKFAKNPEGYLSGEIKPKDCGGKRECEADQKASGPPAAGKAP